MNVSIKKCIFKKILVKSGRKSGKTLCLVPDKLEPENLFENLVPVKPEPEWGKIIQFR